MPLDYGNSSSRPQAAVLCLLSFWMELSKEAYQLIIQNVGNRADICTLARVSRSFQRAAERSLYNTLYLRDPGRTVELCKLLSSRLRLAMLVDALTISMQADSVDGSGDESTETSGSIPEDFWESLAEALRCMTRLRFLNIHLDGDTQYAWILRRCTFQLRAFHCDFAWDADLVSFLNTQTKLSDLYLADFNANPPEIRQQEGHDAPPTDSSIESNSLPALSIVECSFADAITALIPGRPVTRIKTCFSREDTPGKVKELSQLVAALQRSTERLRCLDLADSSYTEEFSLKVLRVVAPSLPDLRYLGTFVLPVGLEVRHASLDVIHLSEFATFFPSTFELRFRGNLHCFLFTSDFNSSDCLCASADFIPLNLKSPTGSPHQARRHSGRSPPNFAYIVRR